MSFHDLDLNDSWSWQFDGQLVANIILRVILLLPVGALLARNSLVAYGEAKIGRGFYIEA